jgi:UDP-N-acetylmuramoyl-L-alanyl-D-glutamate--2,6-diaminopimelate ligase
MKVLSDILYRVSIVATSGSMATEISGICFDTRKIQKGDLFMAIKGTSVDGHDYIDSAIKAGAIAVLCEKFPEQLNESVTYIAVKNTADAAGIIASNYFENPSQQLKLIGITGTNGKTTVATLLFQLFTKLGYRCGLISTVDIHIVDKIIPSTHTTPDQIELNRLLSEMVFAECDYCFMEVSSHALDQCRVSGVKFIGGIFTNITHDHLDYHKTFENYIKAKKKFFDSLSDEAFALVNVDDKRGLVMLQNCKANSYTYAVKRLADYKSKIVSNTIEGLELDINGKQVWFRLIGDFNAYNLTATCAVAFILGEDTQEVLTALSSLNGAPGRFELVLPGSKFTAIVDYAHTPDALRNVLETIQNVRTGTEHIITVVGCGGNRDKGKRPLMASIACKFSDKVILTSDNPRDEDPMQIIIEMQSGVSPTERKKTLVMADREEAIKTACMMAKDRDVVLVAGKGHENYQEIKGVKYPFDDKEVLDRMIKMFAN